MARYRNHGERWVCGVGINDLIDDPVYVDGSIDYTYQIWHSMLVRCYSEKALQKNPRYRECQVSEDLLKFSGFKGFVENLHGFGAIDDSGRRYQLDKDFLGGGWEYSKETLCFIPQELNKFITKSDKARGQYPIGVSRSKVSGKFYASLTYKGKQYHLGTFTTPQEAFQAYKSRKEEIAKGLAAEWSGRIDARVYQKLLSFEVFDDLQGGLK